MFQSGSGSGLSTSITLVKDYTLSYHVYCLKCGPRSNKLLCLEEEHVAEQTVGLRGKEIGVSMSDDKVGGLGL